MKTPSYTAGSSAARTYTTVTNKNQLASAISSDGFINIFEYNAMGATTRVTDGTYDLLKIEYNDWNNKARSIQRPQANFESIFDYAPNNTRVRKRKYDTGVLNHTVYSAGDLEFEYDATNTIIQTKRYVSGNGVGLIYCQEDEKFYWALPDQLGSTRMIIDEEGIPQWLYNYDVYGYPTITQLNSANLIYNLLFTGQYYDAELELYNYGARFYDPTIMRFLQVDPAHQFASPYSYVGGMPNMLIDPSGAIAALALGLIGLGTMLLGGLLLGLSYIPGLKGTAAGDALFTAGLATIAVGTIIATAGASAGLAGGAAANVGLGAAVAPTLGAGLGAAANMVSSAINKQPLNANSILISASFGAASAFGGNAVSAATAKLAGGRVLGVALGEVGGQGLLGAAFNTAEAAAQNLNSGNDVNTGLGEAAILGFGVGAAGGAVTTARFARFMSKVNRGPAAAGLFNRVRELGGGRQSLEIAQSGVIRQDVRMINGRMEGGVQGPLMAKASDTPYGLAHDYLFEATNISLYRKRVNKLMGGLYKFKQM